ncbi:MAG: alpha/beta hydrolase domain-containing protein [Pseudomonadota bacterium]|nr:alpha/beta hydrolase domain-containing protein [Pseudomonadota bacterium]
MLIPSIQSVTRIAALAALCLLSACQGSDAEIERAPKIGLIWTAPTLIPFEDMGYELEEFFFSGTANSYVNRAELTPDGQWEVEPSGETAAYKSRLFVYRPTDPAHFNGSVIIEWMNVSGGIDTPTEWITAHTEFMRQGYAYVAVSAQYVGVEGGPMPLPRQMPFCLAVKCTHPLRYRSLHHPGDSFSYDIFMKAAELVRRPQAINPLGELTAERIIATGESQSAHRLVTLVNAFGMNTDLFDGYFIHSRLGEGIPELGGGASAPLSQAPQADIVPPTSVQLRADLGVPIINLQTETDQIPLGALSSRQPDNSFFRLWEVAGTAHADLYVARYGLLDDGDDVVTAELKYLKRANPVLPACPDFISSAPQHHFAVKAAFRTLHQWLAEATVPASYPRLQVNEQQDGFALDAYGNALGGIRSPYVDAPLARLSGLNNADRNEDGLCFLYGSMAALDPATLQTLYADKADYIAAVTQSTATAVANGTLLAEDAPLVLAAAERVEFQ